MLSFIVLNVQEDLAWLGTPHQASRRWRALHRLAGIHHQVDRSRQRAWWDGNHGQTAEILASTAMARQGINHDGPDPPTSHAAS
jgi:hypothetical protein